MTTFISLAPKIHISLFLFIYLIFVSLSPMLELGIQSRVNFIVISCMGSSKLNQDFASVFTSIEVQWPELGDCGFGCVFNSN